MIRPFLLRERTLATFQISEKSYTNVINYMVYNTLSLSRSRLKLLRANEIKKTFDFITPADKERF